MTSQHLAVVTLHDAAPAFSKRIFEFTDAFENLGINFNVATVPFFHHTEDLSRFPEFVDKLKSYKRCEIVLHGLYHEDRKGHMDDFHTKSKGTTEEEIRAGLEIFEQIGLRTSVFIPPQWKLSSGSIEVLEKLRFSLAEMQEEFFLLSHKPFRKIKVPKVLSWDLTGHPDLNVVRISTEEHRFNLLDDARGRKMIRLAPHPRDPHKVFNEQINMIRELKEQDYTIPLYKELVSELQDAPYSNI
jgi:predicted deacetylase